MKQHTEVDISNLHNVTSRGNEPIYIGHGWEEIVTTLLRLISSFANNVDGGRITVLQVKEKFGSLRFYSTAHADNEEDVLRLQYRVNGAVTLAELLSSSICYVCGQRKIPLTADRPTERRALSMSRCDNCHLDLVVAATQLNIPFPREEKEV